MEPLYMPEDALPPQEVHLTEVRAEPWPDGRRVRVHVDITPFQKPPDLKAIILDESGQEAASALIVESIQHRLVFTMHPRQPDAQKTYTLTVNLSYADLGSRDERSVEFHLAAGVANEPD